jgi:NADPH:quinone reductase-like Zn-dependent oxidoreductase
MQALTYDRYTDSSGLSVTEQPQPEQGEGQVLIRVHAASLNAYDWHMYKGDPTFMRLMQGLRVKERRTVGSDVAGVVEQVGSGVTELSVGDRVGGSIGRGALAEYAVTDAVNLALLPDAVSYEAGAASAMAAVTALQALRDTGGVGQGSRVLVWGASGGVGHFAVQIARALGAAQVDGVCSGANVPMVTSLGADQVFDYGRFEAGGPQPTGPYDVVIDTVVTAPNKQVKRMLADGGSTVIVGALGGGKVLGPVVGIGKRLVGGKLVGLKARAMLASDAAPDVAIVAGWIADGTVTPVIQQTYPLADAVSALRELEAGHVAGKLVITLA